MLINLCVPSDRRLCLAPIVITFHINKLVNAVAQEEKEANVKLWAKPCYRRCSIGQEKKEKQLSEAAATPLKSNVSKTWNSITIMKYNDGFK